MFGLTEKFCWLYGLYGVWRRRTTPVSMRCAASMGMPRSAASLGKRMAQPREREREIGRDACVSCPEQSREGGGGEEAEEERNIKIDKGDRQRPGAQAS